MPSRLPQHLLNSGLKRQSLRWGLLAAVSGCLYTVVPSYAADSSPNLPPMLGSGAVITPDMLKKQLGDDYLDIQEDDLFSDPDPLGLEKKAAKPATEKTAADKPKAEQTTSESAKPPETKPDTKKAEAPTEAPKKETKKAEAPAKSTAKKTAELPSLLTPEPTPPAEPAPKGKQSPAFAGKPAPKKAPATALKSIEAQPLPSDSLEEAPTAFPQEPPVEADLSASQPSPDLSAPVADTAPVMPPMPADQALKPLPEAARATPSMPVLPKTAEKKESEPFYKRWYNKVTGKEEKPAPAIAAPKAPPLATPTVGGIPAPSEPAALTPPADAPSLPHNNAPSALSEAPIPEPDFAEPSPMEAPVVAPAPASPAPTAKASPPAVAKIPPAVNMLPDLEAPDAMPMEAAPTPSSPATPSMDTAPAVADAPFAPEFPADSDIPVISDQGTINAAPSSSAKTLLEVPPAPVMPPAVVAAPAPTTPPKDVPFYKRWYNKIAGKEETPPPVPTPALVAPAPATPPALVVIPAPEEAPSSAALPPAGTFAEEPLPDLSGTAKATAPELPKGTPAVITDPFPPEQDTVNVLQGTAPPAQDLPLPPLTQEAAPAQPLAEIPPGFPESTPAPAVSAPTIPAITPSSLPMEMTVPHPQSKPELPADVKEAFEYEEKLNARRRNYKNDVLTERSGSAQPFVRSPSASPFQPATPAPRMEMRSSFASASPSSSQALSRQTESMLRRFPEKVSSLETPPAKRAPISIDRAESQGSSFPSEGYADNAPVGASAGSKKQTSAATVHKFLDDAYQALLYDQIESAIELYKRVIEQDPEHKLGLFGLATAYQRNHQNVQARQVYERLLRLYPDYPDALNNFLVLVGEEAPDSALTELLQLFNRNPEFSPLPAQIGMVYIKKEDYLNAAQYLGRAVSLSPENLSYRYNLGIAMDNLGEKEEAAKLYDQVLKAARAGNSIGVPLPVIEERLTFLRSNRG